MDEEAIGDQRLAAGVDVLAGKAHAIAVRHFLRGFRAAFSKMLQNSVISARHPVGVKALDILLRLKAKESRPQLGY
nr:hypothetical protein [Halobellus clavatus]